MKLLELFEAYLKNTDRTFSAQFYCCDIQKFGTWFGRQYASFDPAAITLLDLVEIPKLSATSWWSPLGR
jgi:hypothetical protein